MKVFSYTVIFYLTCILSAECSEEIRIRSTLHATTGYDTNIPIVDFGLDDVDETWLLDAIESESSCSHRDIIKTKTANLRRALKAKEKTLRRIFQKYRSGREKESEKLAKP